MRANAEKATRVLDSARELVVRYGVRKVTISEIAANAGVGKGTVYLYWPSKDDLLVALIADELATCCDQVLGDLRADPTLAPLRRLAPYILRLVTGRPLLERLVDRDGDLLRLAPGDSSAARVFAMARPSSLAGAAVRTLRERGLVRTDQPIETQVVMLHAAITGFSAVMTDPSMEIPAFSESELYASLSDTVHLLFEPSDDPSPDVVQVAAQELATTYRSIRDGLLPLQSPHSPK